MAAEKNPTPRTELVRFQNFELACVQDEAGNVFVGINSVAAAIGLHPGKAKESINEHEALSQVVAVRRLVALDGKAREQSTLPLEFLPAWLFTISPNRVSDTARPVLVAFQKECQQVLSRHFFGDYKAARRTQARQVELRRQLRKAEQELEAIRAQHREQERPYRNLRDSIRQQLDEAVYSAGVQLQLIRPGQDTDNAPAPGGA